MNKHLVSLGAGEEISCETAGFVESTHKLSAVEFVKYKGLSGSNVILKL